MTQSTEDQRPQRDRRPARWWLRMLLQPLLVLSAGALGITGLGLAQRCGWISTGGGQGAPAEAAAAPRDSRYVCPMMCTPPQSVPGRCPVCGMALVAAAAGGGDEDDVGVEIEPAARRLAHIQTAAVALAPWRRKIRTVGELAYDEGSLATIAAYVDGRVERLFADYTGVRVEAGDHVALVYSPELYSSQVELVQAIQAWESSTSSSLPRAVGMRRGLLEGARQKLVELGMTEAQVEELKQTRKAKSRMLLCAPIGGTVIEKLAVEGQYIKTGQPIYRIADLSTVWLMLELFPEDAALVRYGQPVETEVRSLPGRTFAGRVAFIDPMVAPKTRTVGVRVVLPNQRGELRPGDYAVARITVPGAAAGADELVYDPEMAGKWIGPRHPHVIEDRTGSCRICGAELVPASTLGYSERPVEPTSVLVVPRSAVLMAGDHSVVYVETKPGRFEIRCVELGPSSEGQAVILAGVQEGDQVAVSGNFLIDSQMQLAGKPSLIDPTRAKATIGAASDDADETRLR